MLRLRPTDSYLYFVVAVSSERVPIIKIKHTNIHIQNLEH